MTQLPNPHGIVGTHILQSWYDNLSAICNDDGNYKGLDALDMAKLIHDTVKQADHVAATTFHKDDTDGKVIASWGGVAWFNDNPHVLAWHMTLHPRKGWQANVALDADGRYDVELGLANDLNLQFDKTGKMEDITKTLDESCERFQKVINIFALKQQLVTLKSKENH